MTQKHGDLLTQSQQSSARLGEVESLLASVTRAKSSAESEVQDLQRQQLEATELITALSAAKTDAERQLKELALQAQRHQDIAVEADRAAAASQRSVEELKKMLNTATADRAETERLYRHLERDNQSLQQRRVQQDRICVDLQTALEAKTAALEQAKALENKTTIEHVHTLEKAMKVQDRQLAEAEAKFKAAEQMIQSLESTKKRLTGELRDL